MGHLWMQVVYLKGSNLSSRLLMLFLGFGGGSLGWVRLNPGWEHDSGFERRAGSVFFWVIVLICLGALMAVSRRQMLTMS